MSREATLVAWLDDDDASTEERVKLPRLVIGQADDSGVDLQRLGLLGEGGMARVEHARHVAMERNVAVKRALDPHDPRAVRGLLREAVLGGQLQHPNIVPVHFVGETGDGEPLVVMRAVTGEPWNARLTRPLPIGPELNTELRVFDAVCQAVSYAHDQGVIHRDLKPANVRLGRYGEVYLLDWGIAVRLDAMSIVPAGSPSYMPPDRAEAEAPDVRFDVHCLGATLLHVVAGTPPRETHTGDPSLEPIEVPDTCPPGLASVIRGACSPQRGDRFPTVEALRRAVVDWQDDHEVQLLLQAAEERLEDLRVAEHPFEARERFAVARFAFEQILQTRLELEAARDGLGACMEVMARWEADDGQEESVKALLASHPSPSEGFQQEVAARLDAALVVRTERNRLVGLARQHDIQAARRAIIQLIVTGFAVVVVTISVSSALLGMRPADAPNIHQRLVTLVVMIALAVIPMAIWQWRALQDSPAGRRAVLMIGVTTLALTAGRVIAWTTDLRLANGVAAPLVYEGMFACGLSVGSLFQGRIFLLPAAVVLAGWAVTVAFLGTSLVPLVYNAVTLTWIIVFAWAWMRTLTRRDAQ